MKKKKNKYPDWLVRAVKTFVQAFGGVVIPELIMILNGGFPESFSLFWQILSPFVAAGLAAGISAVWNIIREKVNDVG